MIKPGKLPKDFLLKYIYPRCGAFDKDLIVGPIWGVDAAVIKMGDKYLIVTSDPITAASKYIGWLAVNIVTNDIAVMGGSPRWMTITYLLRKRISEEEIDNIAKQVDEAAKLLNVSVIGGHSEITSYLENNIVIGNAIGIADRYYLSANAQVGDLILLTKGAAIEGTAVLSMEFEDKLLSSGISEELVIKAKNYIKEISVLKETSLLIRKYGDLISAMHDPTEGGILSALHEVADSSGVGLEADLSRIHIREETKVITKSLNVDPLALLSSGALLATVKPDVIDEVLDSLRKLGIWADVIGEIKNKKYGKFGIINNKKVPLPYPERDEIWKVF